MTVSLASNHLALLAHIQASPQPDPADTRLTLYLYAADGTNLPDHVDAIRPYVNEDSFVPVDIASNRLSRINFDIVERVIVDLPAKTLLDPLGRRLLDALARLAEETLDLVLTGDNVVTAGAYLPDADIAALNLIPRSVILPEITSVDDLRALLESISQRQLRLLALDGSLTASYEHATEMVSVVGNGSVLLAAFVQKADESVPTARIHMLSSGMQSKWPE